MSRSPEGPDSDLLFDLPLDGPMDPVDDPPPRPKTETASAGGAGGGNQVTLDFPPEGAPSMDPPALVEAPLAPRFLAGVLDLVVLAAVLGLALLALRLLVVPMSRAAMIPLGVFLASFSFLYTVVPLAFWGHTPGMAYTGIMSRAKSGDFLTIRQCMLRWIGWALTIATAGLAGLLALSGVSVSDLVSGSRIFRRPPG